MEFFMGWQMWEKLLFVLACAMVITVMLGGVKLIYAHWRLHRIVAESERQDLAMQRTASQRSRRSQTSQDVPFGIRAIESGIEIEGVWISRGNTPEPSSPGISLDSSKYNHISPGGSESPKSVKENTLHLSLAGPRVTRHTQTSTLLTTEPRSTRPPSDDSSRGVAITKPPRSKYPPLSYAKYGGNPYVLRNSAPGTTLHGLDAIHKASTSIYIDEGNGSSDSSYNSTNSTGDIDSISASAPGLLTDGVQPRSVPRSSSELELLDSHRESQAAETGQLTPRGSRHGQSYSLDWGVTRLTSHGRSQPLTKITVARPTLPSSSSDPGTSAQPQKSSLPPKVGRASMPDVTPFIEFCKRAPQVSRPPSLRSCSKDSSHSATPSSGAQSPIESAATSPIIPASEGAAQLKLPPPRRMSFEKTSAQVIRGHGAGFEILKPGSLNSAKMENRRAAPPVSLQTAYGARLAEDGRNKLQKKRRSSLDSCSASTNSRRSRLSMLF